MDVTGKAFVPEVKAEREETRRRGESKGLLSAFLLSSDAGLNQMQNLGQARCSGSMPFPYLVGLETE